jgi:hypothetical protein
MPGYSIKMDFAGDDKRFETIQLFPANLGEKLAR